MKLCKKLVVAVLVIALCLGCVPAAFAEGAAELPEGYDFYVYIDAEAFTMGWGFLLEPVAVPAKEGENLAALTLRAFEQLGLACNYSGSPESGMYLRGIECPYTVPNVPSYLMEQFDIYPAWAEANLGMAYGSWTGSYTDDGLLMEMEYSGFGGWMFAVNDVCPPVGCDGVTVAAGDVYRWMFTVYGWGMDCGLNDGWGMFPEFDNPAEGVLRSEALKGYADLVSDPIIAAKYAEGGSAHAEYVAFLETVGNIESTQAEIDAAYAALFDASYDCTVYVDFEAFTMGWGYLAEPFAVPANTGENLAKVTLRALDMAGLDCVYGGSAESGFYLRGVECPYTVPNVPMYLMDQLEAYPEWAEEEMGGGFGEWTGAYTDDGILCEMEYSGFAGWMFAENDVSGYTGADGVIVTDGNMYRWMFTVYGWGMDCGLNDGWGMFPEFNNPAEGVLRSEVSVGYAQLAANEEYAAMMAEGGSAHEAYLAYVNAVTNIESNQNEIDAAYAALVAALTGGQSALLGDADCNGSVNFGDVSAVYMYVLGLLGFTAQGETNADMNFDGSVNFGDVSALYMYLIGE